MDAAVHLEHLPTRITKGELLTFLTEAAGIDRRRVRRIELRGSQATVEVPQDWQSRVVKAADGAMLRDRRIRARAAATRTTSSTPDHFQRLARLLDWESRAEASQTAERLRRVSGAQAETAGTSLVDLAIEDQHPGLGGRFLLRLAKRNRSIGLPWTRLGTGSPVLVCGDSTGAVPGQRGVVCERTERVLLVAINEPLCDEAAGGSWRVDLAHDEVAIERQRDALERARTARGDRLAQLRDVLLGARPPAFRSAPASGAGRIAMRDQFSHAAPAGEAPALPHLNDPQREAVRFALAAEDLALIHGPPGTGKTTVAVEIIRAAVGCGQKVLACAPSNLAVDNMLERLLQCGVRAVRLGHPARVLAELRAHTLDLIVEDHDDVRLARKLVRQAFALFRKAGKFTRAKPEPGARGAMRRDARELLADARRIESQSVEEVLNRAEVVCATTTGIDSAVVGPREFDLAVIDEACQSTEPGCWAPVLRARRVVLAGDHCQLPPTVVSAEAAREGFGVSLFERLVDLYGDRVARRLTVQYRMHEAIMGFSSAEFYQGELCADASVRHHVLADLPGVRATPLTRSPVWCIDTAGAGYDEEPEPDGESRFNPSEAELVVRKVCELIETGVPASAIGVITPYAAQARWLENRLSDTAVEIDTVDGFQGREKEAIVISLVRSNRSGELGFLDDTRRTNVALTRARRLLLVVADAATLAAHPFYERLFAYFEQIGAYHTVWEEES